MKPLPNFGRTPDPDDLTPDQQALLGMLREDAVNRYMDGDQGALSHSVAMNPSDPAFWMLTDGKTSTTAPYRESCYICRDPEYAVMGLPLCYQCARCGGHIAADDEICDDCGWCINPFSQTGADGLAPDGFPEAVREGSGPLRHDGEFLYPYGDFETEELFLVPRGTTDYRGLPEYDGDLWDKDDKAEGDYVENLQERVPWRGTVIAVEGHMANEFRDGEFTPPRLFVTEVQVRIDDPAGGVNRARQAGCIVYCQPGWLKIIRRAA